MLERLVASSDVVVANMRPEALARLGLDADGLRDRYPRLVHCTITGFGPGGPYRGRPAYDSVVQGVSGIAGLAERRDGRPLYVPLLLADHVTGEIAASAILAALLARERTGLGATLEVPMHETMAAFVLQEHLGPRSFDPPLGPAGDAACSTRNRPLATADGWISLTANTDAQVHAFLRAVGRPELIDDPRAAHRRRPVPARRPVVPGPRGGAGEPDQRGLARGLRRRRRSGDALPHPRDPGAGPAPRRRRAHRHG